MNKVQLRISGRVQGVAFRHYTREKALELGLTGYVMNLPDGSVKVYVAGESEAVRKMVKWCHSGSPASLVAEVQIDNWDMSVIPTSFEIKR